ncbi:MAG: response regulator [Azonexaceae bacterium]|nr:response regulator [Azonexaceae bacterium]
MSAGPWRVLAADDDPTARLLMQAALAGGDFVLTLAEDGSDALAKFQSAAFDLALLDVEMPGLDGFALCAAIRQTHGAGFPVILVTGRRDSLFLERLRQLSAGHIAKPIDWAALAGQLRSLLAAETR